jgi:hypothetical protein
MCDVGLRHRCSCEPCPISTRRRMFASFSNGRDTVCRVVRHAFVSPHDVATQHKLSTHDLRKHDAGLRDRMARLVDSELREELAEEAGRRESRIKKKRSVDGSVGASDEDEDEEGDGEEDATSSRLDMSSSEFNKSSKSYDESSMAENSPAAAQSRVTSRDEHGPGRIRLFQDSFDDEGRSHEGHAEGEEQAAGATSPAKVPSIP